MQQFLQQQQISKLRQLKVSLATPDELKQKQKQKLPTIPHDLFFSGEKLVLTDLIPSSSDILLYHATNIKSLMNILEHGIQVRSGTGTLGPGFYVTPTASASIQWARRGGQTVVIELAVRDPNEATVSCVPRNSEFQKNCRSDCMFYTAYETKFMHRYKGGFFPHFWQYVVKDQKYFDNRNIYIKQIFIIVREKQRRGGAAVTALK